MNTTNEMVAKILSFDCCDYCGFCQCESWRSETPATNEMVTRVGKAKVLRNEMRTTVRTIYTAREVVATSIETALQMAA